MSKEKQCECCHEWWYGSDVKESLCPNCYGYFKQLKQQLEEKDKQIDIVSRDNNSYKYNIDEQKRIIHDFAKQLKEKDKEIEELKQQLEETNAGYDFTYEQSRETIKELKQNQIQLAISELEKVKDTLKHFCNIHNDEYYGVKSQVKGIEQDVCEEIDNQIKVLKGE